MRIGEILLKQGLLTAAQRDAALAAQRQFGGRLGTSLIDLGYVDIDVVARALGTQLGVDAGLVKDFATIDARAVALVPARLAEDLKAMPLRIKVTVPPRLVVALINPLVTPVEELAFVAGMRIEVRVAPELQVLLALEEHYGIKRAERYVRVDFKKLKTTSSIPAPRRPSTHPALEPDVMPASLRPAPRILSLTPPPMPSFDASSAPLPVLIAPSERPAPAPTRRTRRSSAGITAPRRIDARIEPDAPPPSPSTPLRRRTSKRIQVVEEPVRPPARLPSQRMKRVPESLKRAPSTRLPRQRPARSIADALKEIAAASSRDAIGDGIVAYLRATYALGLVWIVRDAIALGWKGFAPGVDASVIEALSFPLASPSVLRVAYEQRLLFRGAPPRDGAMLNRRLWKALRCTEPGEVIVAPVAIGKRIVNLVYAHAEDGGVIPDAAAVDLGRVCGVAAERYAELIRRK